MFNNIQLLLICQNKLKLSYSLNKNTVYYYKHNNFYPLNTSLEIRKYTFSHFNDFKNTLFLCYRNIKQNYQVVFKPLNNKKLYSLSSQHPIFKWYERELFEFNNILIYNSIDNRNLLLPYNQKHNINRQKDYDYKPFYPVISHKNKKVKFVNRQLITL